jgi:hypothetical protein
MSVCSDEADFGFFMIKKRSCAFPYVALFFFFSSLYFLTCFNRIEAIELQYGLYAQKKSSIPIEYAQLFGERCSGTNYFQELLRRNFGLETRHNDFGWKHFPVWLQKSPWFDSVLRKRGGSPFLLKENKKHLFFVIFRDPYEWLWSFNIYRHHADPIFHNKVGNSFSQFIREPWIPEDRFKWIDCEPNQGGFFSNVIKLRTARLKNMIELRNHVENIYYIQYETLRDFPIEVMKEISQLFGMPRDHFFVVNQKCTPGGEVSQTPFIKKSALFLLKEDLLYINSELDEETERAAGYAIRTVN